jgi:hypothetical protein
MSVVPYTTNAILLKTSRAYMMIKLTDGDGCIVALSPGKEVQGKSR